MAKYYTVMGLEIHAQLKTDSKLFCGCKLEFGSPANQNVCPICLAMPGTLPVPNRKAVNLAIRLGHALNCEIDMLPMWTRKNYFYPDLPKGYQITQTGGIPEYDHPICKNGYIDIVLEDGTDKRIRINRIHMEEDAGKLTHDLDSTHSHFDANRCGTPLCEIVTEADIRSPKEAVIFLTKLKSILQYTGVCDANMEKGNMRADSNISLRTDPNGEFGTRAEIKNLNSFSNLEKASYAEIDFQAATLDAGKEVEQCTKRYDVNTGKTLMMRSKEDALDYRYMPEPDMLRMTITDEMVETQRKLLPELPDARKARYVKDLELSEYDAGALTADKAIADLFEEVYESSKNAKLSANWILNEVLRNIGEGDVADLKIKAAHLSELVTLISKKTISGTIAKKVFEMMLESGEMPEALCKKHNLVQVSDTGAIEKVVAEVIAENDSQVQTFLGGNDKVKGFLVGMCMRKMQGKGNPAMVNEFLDKALAALK
jgi:aspartyl-tRNA(Asn)/glutamyl-tRNA(Gln) amidotransferase subunit B